LLEGIADDVNGAVGATELVGAMELDGIMELDGTAIDEDEGTPLDIDATLPGDGVADALSCLFEPDQEPVSDPVRVCDNPDQEPEPEL
jgi:hypothetical protein